MVEYKRTREHSIMYTLDNTTAYPNSITAPIPLKHSNEEEPGPRCVLAKSCEKANVDPTHSDVLAIVNTWSKMCEHNMPTLHVFEW